MVPVDRTAPLRRWYTATSKSGTEAGWDACNQRSHPGERQPEPLTDWISESERRARLTRELETRQRPRTGVDILGEPEHLKSPTEHFGVQQGLQLAFGFRRIR